MKHSLVPLLALLLLTACESTAWTAETCNNNLEADVEDFEEYKTQFRKAQEGLANAERTGNASNVKAFQQSVKEWKSNLETMLGFIDRDMIPECDGKFSQELLAKTEEVRRFVKGDTATKSHEAEGMPDLRVTKIESAFIPVEFDPNGGCSGPYLELTYTVSNQGGDFPRPVDLEEYAKRAQQPPENLEFFNIYGELDFGNDSRTSADFEVKGGRDGMIKKGGSLQLKKKVRVEHNQTHGKAWGYVQSSALLKNGGNSVRYETEVDVPIWDIYTQSHKAIGGTDKKDKKYYIGTMAYITNNGKSPTPGPVQASFVIYEEETGRYITGWTGQTQGPVTGAEMIVAKTPIDRKLPARIKVHSSIIPLCPDGKSGNLADGNAKDNSRELRQEPDSPSSTAGQSQSQPEFNLDDY